jgi:ribose-phosphate pyrophosphokinase
VNNRTCLILDDIVDTAGTLVKTAQALLDAGALSVYACASHAVLSGPALERISKSNLKELVVTNTIPLSEAGQKEPKIKVLTIAGLIARAIQSIHEETSVSKLFN